MHMGEFQNEFQEAYLNREELKKGGDGRIREQKHLKHGEMEETFMNFVSATAERDAAFTELTTTDTNLTTQLRQQEDQILDLQADMCNLKVLAAVKTTEGGGASNTGGNSNTRTKNHEKNFQPTRMIKNTTTTTTTAGHTNTAEVAPISLQHERRQNLDTRRKQHIETKWGDKWQTRREFVRKSKKKADEMIRNIVY